MLHLAGDLHPRLAGVLAEPLDPALPGRLDGVLARVLAELDVGERPHDQDLLPVHPDLRGPLEPLRRDPTLQPRRHLRLGLGGLREAEMLLVPMPSHTLRPPL